MFVGHALDKPADCYKMWDLEKSAFCETRDIVWLKRMCFAKKVPQPEVADELVQIDVNTKEDKKHTRCRCNQ